MPVDANFERWLTVYEPLAEPVALRLLPSVYLIGRSLSCDIRLKHCTVSRLHALIDYDDGSCLVRDLCSHNGTVVNGRRVGAGSVQVLALGSTASVGKVTMELVAANPGRHVLTPDKEPSTRSIQSGNDQHIIERLTPAQQRVFQLLLQGMTEQRAADMLFLSTHTVHNHVKAIYRTLRVRSRAELLLGYHHLVRHEVAART